MSAPEGAAWWLLALGLATTACGMALAGIGSGGTAADAWMWRRDRLPGEFWRLWTAALVHQDLRHLIANLAGAVAVGAYGWAAGCGRAQALAWAIAWPLTHAALWPAAGVATLAGLSGVLHAGVAVAVVHLLCTGRGLRRGIGVVTGLGLLAKLALEQPWLAPVQADGSWPFPVVVLVHATGAAAGAVAGVVAWATSRWRADATITR